MPALRFHVLFALAVAITGLSQSSPTDGFSSCGQICLNTIVPASDCQSLSNTNCICSDTTVQANLRTCLQNCSDADLAEGETLQSSYCP